MESRIIAIRKKSRIKMKRLSFGKEMLTVILILVFCNHAIFSLQFPQNGIPSEELISDQILQAMQNINFAKGLPSSFSKSSLLVTSSLKEDPVEVQKSFSQVACKLCYHILQDSTSIPFTGKDMKNQQNNRLTSFGNISKPLMLNWEGGNNKLNQRDTSKRKIRRRKIGRRASNTKRSFHPSNFIIKNLTRPKRQLDRLMIAIRMKNINSQNNNTNIGKEVSGASTNLQKKYQNETYEHRQSFPFASTPTLDNRLLPNNGNNMSLSRSKEASSGQNDHHFEIRATHANLSSEAVFDRATTKDTDFFNNIPSTSIEMPFIIKSENIAMLKPSSESAVGNNPSFQGDRHAIQSVDLNAQEKLLTNDSFDEVGNNTVVLEQEPVVNTEGDEDDISIIRQFIKRYPVELWKRYGWYEDAYLDQIDKHWLQYEPASDIVHYILAAVYGVFMIVGCSGNALVIFMFIRCRSLRTPANYLIVNLALSDFLMMAKTPLFIVNSIFRGPVLGAIGCKIYGFVGGLSGTASIMSLASISLDRYYVIVHPLNPFKRITSKRAIILIIAVWLYAGLFSAIPLFGIVNKYTSEGYLTSCSFDYLSEKVASQVFVFIFFLAAWFLPATVICFSYVQIYRMVKAVKMEILNGKDTRETFSCRQEKEKLVNELKIAVLAGKVISLWLLSWTPYAVVALMGIAGWKQYLTPLVSAVPALFCKTSSCLNCFLYAHNHPRFKRELRSKFKVCFVGYQQQRVYRDGNNGSCSAITFRVRLEGGFKPDNRLSVSRKASRYNSKFGPNQGKLENREIEKLDVKQLNSTSALATQIKTLGCSSNATRQNALMDITPEGNAFPLRSSLDLQNTLDLATGNGKEDKERSKNLHDTGNYSNTSFSSKKYTKKRILRSVLNFSENWKNDVEVNGMSEQTFHVSGKVFPKDDVVLQRTKSLPVFIPSFISEK